MTEIDVVANLKDVEAKIAAAAEDAARNPADISLTLVSKTWEADDIRPLLDAGHRRFGENRVQEAQGKWPELKDA